MFNNKRFNYFIKNFFFLDPEETNFMPNTDYYFLDVSELFVLEI